MTPEQMLKPKEAAKVLGVGMTLFWDLATTHKFPRYEFSPRAIRFKAQDIETFRENRRIAGPQDERRLVDGRRGA